jgi:hypothetical protein
MPDTPDGTTSSNFSGGDVSLPNDQILSATQPSAQQPTSPASVSSPASAPPAPGPQAGNAPPQPAPGQQQPSQAVVPGKVDPSKTPTPGQPTGAPTTPPVDPAVKKASRFYDVAEALAGGPRYKYNVDATGNMQKTQVPVSGAHLGLAIAMEALSGMAAGLGVKPGPGVEGRAAAAGFQAGRQQGQSQNQQSQQQAQQDYARKAQVTETNMRQWQIARNVGRQDEATHQTYIDHYKPLINTLQAKAPGSLIGPLKYSDFAKYNVTEHNVIPFESVPRLDDKGNQVLDSRGVPQYDDNYYAVKPGTKLSGLFNKDDLATAKQMGYKWADNDLVIDSPMELSNYLNIKGQLTSWGTSQDSYNKYFDMLEKGKDAGTTPTGSVSSATTGEGDKIAFKNPDIAPAVANNAKKYNVPASMINAVIQHESAGDPKAKSPTSTASGLMQLIDSTAKSNGVTDPFNIQQNVEGGTKYLADLLDKTKHPNINGDPRLAFAAYAAGPGAVDAKGNIVDTKDQKADVTTKYANDLFKLAGLANNQAITAAQAGTTGTAGASQATRPNMADWTKDHQTFPQDNDLFQSQLAHTDGSYGKAIAAMLGSKDPAQVSAAKDVSAFMGGADQISAHDDMVTAQKEQVKLDQTEAEGEKKAEAKNTLDQQASQHLQSFLSLPANYKINPDVQISDSPTARAALQAQGVKIPSNFDALWRVGHYMAPEAGTLPARTWQKGSPDEMDAQTGVSYIGQFINPGYNATKYGTAQRVRTENASGNYNNGKAIQNAGTAVQHLDLLRQAGDALQNGDVQKINQLANQLGVQIGQSPAMTYQAISQIAAQEVEKVAAGGTIPYKEAIEQGLKTLSVNASPEQREGVIKAYTGLMSGRLSSIDYNTFDNLGEHLTNVRPEVTALFQKYGYEAPWAKNGAPQQPQQPQPPQAGAIAGRDGKGNIVAWKLPNGTIQKVTPPTTQQAAPQGR